MYCLSNFCCVCRTQDLNLHNINDIEDDNITIKNKLTFVMNSCAQWETHLYKYICINCLADIRIAYKVKKSFIITTKLTETYNAQLKYFSGSNNKLSELKVDINMEDSKLAENTPNKISYSAESKKQTNRSTFRCSICDKKYPLILQTFSSLTQLKHHIVLKHCDEKHLICHHCPAVQFLNKNFLLKHMKLKHKAPNFKCKICKHIFLIKLDYDRHTREHIKVNNNEIKKFSVCNICDKRFFYKNNLKIHLRKHEKKKNNMLPKTNDNKINNQNSINEETNKTQETVIDSVTTKEHLAGLHEVVEKLEEEEEKDVEIVQDDVINSNNVFICEFCNTDFLDINLYNCHLSLHD